MEKKIVAIYEPGAPGWMMGPVSIFWRQTPGRIFLHREIHRRRENRYVNSNYQTW